MKTKQPKKRNWVAKALSNPLYRGRAERDRTKYTRKNKHKLKSE